MNDLEYKVKVLKQYLTLLLKKCERDNSRSIGITTTGLKHIIKQVDDIEKMVINMPCGKGKRK